MAQEQRRVLSTDPNAGERRVLSPDPSAGQQPSDIAPEAEPEPTWLDQVLGIPEGWWRNVNPVTAVKGIGQAAAHPVETVRGIGEAQGRLGQEAQAAFESGDYKTGLRKSIHYLLPLIGPALDEASNKFAEGKWGEGTGESLGIGTALFGPSAVSRARSFRGTDQGMQPPQPRAPVDRAVAFGQSNQIPMDAATASQSGAVRAVQRRASDSLGGADIAERFQNRQAHALTRTGDRLSREVSPTPTPPEMAGQRVRTAVEGRVSAFTRAADDAYTELRGYEAQQAQRVAEVGAVRSPSAGLPGGKPFTTVPLAVDIAQAKAQLRPIYDALMQERNMAPLQGARARAAVALDRLMTADDLAPLSIVDGALGDLKALQRSAGSLPGASQIGEMVGALDAQVKAAAVRGGPQVTRALMRGRTNTIARHRALDTLEKINEEPVRAFNQMTFSNDAGIAQLRRVQQLAPEELRRVGRAWLDERMATATQEGGFQHSQRLYADWNRLGPETRKLIFGDPALVKDLDSFFLLAKKIAENPNPSGTARSLMAFNVLSSVIGLPVSALMHSPAGVRLVTRGAAIPASNTRALQLWRADAMALLQREGAAVGSLAETSDPEEAPPDTQRERAQ